MNIQTNVRLTKAEVNRLLNYFDDSSDTPLHEGLDFVNYSKKLSRYAHFILVWEKEKLMAFLTYYLNDEEHFVYVPQVVVHKDGRHKGIGHKMFVALKDFLNGKYETIQLEVLKNNHNARKFYEREGFIEKEDRKERILLSNNMRKGTDRSINRPMYIPQNARGLLKEKGSE